MVKYCLSGVTCYFRYVCQVSCHLCDCRICHMSPQCVVVIHRMQGVVSAPLCIFVATSHRFVTCVRCHICHICQVLALSVILNMTESRGHLMTYLHKTDDDALLRRVSSLTIMSPNWVTGQ